MSQNASSKIGKLIALLTLATLAGCTSLQDTGLSSEELQARIRAGGLVQAGDRVALRTSNGRELVMAVEEISQDALRGSGTEVPIDDIIMLRTERIDPIRSAGAAAGGAVIIYVAGAIIAFISLLNSI